MAIPKAHVIRLEPIWSLEPHCPKSLDSTTNRDEVYNLYLLEDDRQQWGTVTTSVDGGPKLVKLENRLADPKGLARCRAEAARLAEVSWKPGRCSFTPLQTQGPKFVQLCVTCANKLLRLLGSSRTMNLDMRR